MYTIDKASKLINKWLGESCNESESEMKISDNSDSYSSDESDKETIDRVAPNELLDNSANLEPLNVDFKAGNESVTESMQNKQKEKLNIKYIIKCCIRFKEGESI